MKNLKKLISLLLIIAIIASLTTVAVVPTSAQTKEKFEYKITVKTADIATAGTKSKLDLFLLDKSGNILCSHIMLKDEGELDNFKQNGIYCTKVTTYYKVEKASVLAYASDNSDNWKPEFIEVENLSENDPDQFKTFYFDKWIEPCNATNLSDQVKNWTSASNVKMEAAPRLPKKYEVNIHLGGHSARSDSFFSIELKGTKGSASTNGFLLNYDVRKLNINADDLGDITHVTFYAGLELNDAFVNYVEIISYYEIKENGKIKVIDDGCRTILYGGVWLMNGDYTISKHDNVYKINIKTADVQNAGTDLDVYMRLLDEKGTNYYEVKAGTFTRFNASEIHPENNAFESGDDFTFYLRVPDDFGKLQKISFLIDDYAQAWTGPYYLITLLTNDWEIDSVTATKVSGNNVDLGTVHHCDDNQRLTFDVTKGYFVGVVYHF